MKKKLNYQFIIGLGCTLFVVGVVLSIFIILFIHETTEPDAYPAIAGYEVTNIFLVVIITILYISIHNVLKSKKNIGFFQYK